LAWGDADLLAGIITVRLSKHGGTRRVPMDSVVQAALVDVAADRTRPGDPQEPIYTVAYRTVALAFERAVAAAQAMLRAAGQDTGHLDGYTWHGNRHTFASRLVMAGVDLLSVKELGGWKTFAMVQRYGHLAPEHLSSAVERLVTGTVTATPERQIEAVSAGTVAGQF
jgi:site-specific recombinase XerD